MVGDTEALLGEVEDFLTGGRARCAPDRELLTVLFTDIVDAHDRPRRALGDERWRALLSDHDKAVRAELDALRRASRSRRSATRSWRPSGPPSQAVRCARARPGGRERLGISLRAGLHTGECELIGGDVGGMAVHIAARVSAPRRARRGARIGNDVRHGRRRPGPGVDVPRRGDAQGRARGQWPLFALQL